MTRLAAQAFRRPVEPTDIEALMRFYDDGRQERDFESGIASALEAILASPQFVFRVEPSAARVATLRASAGQAASGPRYASSTGQPVPSASATSRSRRGCRSSSGRRRPTPS